MDVILNIVGHIEVDDNADVLHVQPSGSHVSRYKHREASLLKFSQGRVSLLLGLVTVNATRRVSLTLNSTIRKKENQDVRKKKYDLSLYFKVLKEEVLCYVPVVSE